MKWTSISTLIYWGLTLLAVSVHAGTIPSGQQVIAAEGALQHESFTHEHSGELRRYESNSELLRLLLVSRVPIGNRIAGGAYDCNSFDSLGSGRRCLGIHTCAYRCVLSEHTRLTRQVEPISLYGSSSKCPIRPRSVAQGRQNPSKTVDAFRVEVVEQHVPCRLPLV